MIGPVEIRRCLRCGAETTTLSEAIHAFVFVVVILLAMAVLLTSDPISVSHDVRYVISCLLFVVFALVLRWFKVNVCIRCRYVGEKSVATGSQSDNST